MCSFENLFKIISQDTTALDVNVDPTGKTKLKLKTTKSKGGRGRKPRKCFCIQAGTKKVFKSTTELARYLGVTKSCVNVAIYRGSNAAKTIVGIV